MTTQEIILNMLNGRSDQEIETAIKNIRKVIREVGGRITKNMLLCGACSDVVPVYETHVTHGDMAGLVTRCIQCDRGLKVEWR